MHRYIYGSCATCTTMGVQYPLQASLNFLRKRSFIYIDGLRKSPEQTAATNLLRLNDLQCKKGGTLNALARIEPFELALGRRR